MGFTGVIADAAIDFKKILDQYQFERTAKCILSDQLDDYDRFYEIISFMTSLKCPMICRERADSGVACNVRKCCFEKDFYACYECDDFEACDKLKSLMEGLHYEASLKNLKAIKQLGLEELMNRGKRHHYWDER